jgi:hypothetical protein
MTEEDVGMTEEDVGMTEEDVGMTEEAYWNCSMACDCPERE